MQSIAKPRHIGMIRGKEHRNDFPTTFRYMQGTHHETFRT